MKNFEKWWEHEMFFLESCKERSKLSVDGFWGLRDHLVAQKFNLKIFSSKMTLTDDPPLLTYLRDITQSANQGGGYLYERLFSTFFSKNTISERLYGPRTSKKHSRIA